MGLRVIIGHKFVDIPGARDAQCGGSEARSGSSRCHQVRAASAGLIALQFEVAH